jgi:hypothetical protein
MNGKSVAKTMNRRAPLLSQLCSAAMGYSCLPDKLAMIFPDIGYCHWLAFISGKEPVIRFRIKMNPPVKNLKTFM